MLASGSSGNSVLVETQQGGVLVDCGLSGAEAERRMTKAGCSPAHLDAIVVSHEHTDHIQGVGILARRFGLPVYISSATLAACNGHLDRGVETVAFEPGREFFIKSLLVRPFSIPHDAADPVGFTFRQGNVKAGVATDIGFATALAVRHLAACNLLVLEANHDPEMLARGPYPWELKRRIRGRMGHLSNDEAGRLLEKVMHDDLEGVVLAHLSDKNNSPALARKAAEAVLKRFRMEERVSLAVADQCEVLTVAARTSRRQPA